MVGCEGAFDLGDELTQDDRGNNASTSTGANNSDRGNNATTENNNNVTIQSGLELYTTYCASCHGAEGLGTPIWEDPIQGYTNIEDIVVNGRGDAMPPMDYVSLEEIAEIQAYLVSLAPTNEELDGEGLYTRYCASCHGADATGDVEWPVSLQGYENIEPIVQNGRGDMDAVAITIEETAEIQAWLLTLAPPLSSLNGIEVYDRLCVGCHGEQGAGTANGGYQLRYDDDPYSEFWTRNGRATTIYDDPMPAYPVETISNQQLDEMFVYLNSAPKPTSGQGLYNQYCANCHGLDGSGGPSRKGIRGEGETDKVRNGDGGTNYANRTNYMTGWNTTQLTDAEVQMINAYVAGL